jgi:predicted negative regulator of RcsB-dependent stress response
MIAVLVLGVAGFIGYSSYKNNEANTVDHLATALIEALHASLFQQEKDFSSCIGNVSKADEENEKEASSGTFTERRKFYDQRGSFYL